MHSNSKRRPIIIAMGGRAQSGKTRLSMALHDHLVKRGLQVKIIPFALPVKKMLSTLGLTTAHLFGDQKETPSVILGGATPRFAMQSLATGWGREMLYDDIWVDAWKRAVAECDADVIIADDLRHVPELVALRDAEAFIYEVYRISKEPRGFVNRFKFWWKQLHAHPSERLDFEKNNVNRFVVEEGTPDSALKKFLAANPFLF